jgi:hypothetical protein
MRETPTLKFYKGGDVVVVGIRGTVPTDGGDVKADALIALNKLETSPRFKKDLATLQGFQRQWPIGKFKYFGVGHSLGGAILDSFLEMGLLTKGVSYNPAVQPKNFSKMAGNNERIYAQNDPLYAVMGKQLEEKPEVRSAREKSTLEKAIDYVPYVGKIYDSYQGHMLDQFEGGARGRRSAIVSPGPLKIQTKEIEERGVEQPERAKDTRDASQISPAEMPRAPWYVRYRKCLLGFGKERKKGGMFRGRRSAIVSPGPLKIQTKDTESRPVEASEKDPREAWQIPAGDIQKDPWYIRYRKCLLGFGKVKGGMRDVNSKVTQTLEEGARAMSLGMAPVRITQSMRARAQTIPSTYFGVPDSNATTPTSSGSTPRSGPNSPKVAPEQQVSQQIAEMGRKATRLEANTNAKLAKLAPAFEEAKPDDEDEEHWAVRWRKCLFGCGHGDPEPQTLEIDHLLLHNIFHQLRDIQLRADKIRMPSAIRATEATLNKIKKKIRDTEREIIPNNMRLMFYDMIDDIRNDLRTNYVEGMSESTAEPWGNDPLVLPDSENPISGTGKDKFSAQLAKAGMSPSAYLNEAKRRAKAHHYPYKLLGFASDGIHKLAIPDANGRVVTFGRVGYGDHLIYSHMEASGKVKSGTAGQKQKTFQKSHSKIKGDWQKNPFSPNNLALKILW